LLKQAGIKRVYLPLNRELIAVSAGRQLVLIGADGSSYGVHTFASPVLSAAWHPDSRQIACSTAQTMWNIDPSGRLGKLKSYTTMKDSWASDVPQLVPVYAIDSLAWSATGRYLACDVRVHVSKDWNKPYVVAYDTQSGRSKQVDEGFSNGDGYFSWGPAEDWMALAGNEGDADSGVWIRRAWSGDSYQVYGTGTSPQFLQTSWRPGATELALYSSDRISITAEVVAPIYGVQMVDISEARNYGQDSGKLMSDIRRSLKSTPKTRSVESGIPNFDWSSDGAMCVAVSNIYTFRQWNSKPVPDMSVEQRLTGRPLSQIEISLCDGGQRVVWDGQYPEEPRFSPSGDAVSYISGGDLWVREVRTEPRSKERAGYWFKIGSGGFKSGDFAEAVTALRNSIRHQPNSPEAHRMLSDIYVSLARSERNPYRKYMLLSAASFESQNSGSRNASHTDWLRAHVSQIRAERAACSQDEARRPAAH
jgi:hypothetical protein